MKCIVKVFDPQGIELLSEEVNASEEAKFFTAPDEYGYRPATPREIGEDAIWGLNYRIQHR